MPVGNQKLIERKVLVQKFLRKKESFDNLSRERSLGLRFLGQSQRMEVWAPFLMERKGRPRIRQNFRSLGGLKREIKLNS